MIETIFEPCCEYGPDPRYFPHNTPEQCGQQLEPKQETCDHPSEHHPYRRKINLHRGEWIYIVTDRNEDWVNTTSDVVEAFRIACGMAGYRPALKRIRKGLAYGFIVTGPTTEFTIVPTPRSKR